MTVGLTNLTTEPCVGAAPLSNPNLAAVCIAQGAPAATIGSIAPPNSGQATLTGGGNPNVKPETSNSYTLGLVLPPTFLPGFTASVDYYNIKVRGAITTPTPDDAINLCFANLTAASATDPNCTNIGRNPGTGQLSGSPTTTFGLPLNLSNQGKLATDGADVILNYGRDIGFAKLGLSFNGNYTAHAKFQATAVSVNRDCVGFYSVNCLSIQPKYQWNLRTTLGFEAFDVSLLWRHISSTKFEPLAGTRFSGTLTGGDLNGQTANFNKIKAYDWFDLSGRVSVLTNFELTLAVQNLLDRKPTVVGNTIGNAAFNSGNTYPSTYDSLGRRYAIGARVKF